MILWAGIASLIAWVLRELMLINNNIGRGQNNDEPISPDLISAAQLEHIMRSPSIATATTRRLVMRYHGAINLTLHRYEISSTERITAFLAQVGHESGRLLYARRIWEPTAAQQRYEGRSDLGNVQRGDGKALYGRSLIQITGRANYQQVSDALGVDSFLSLSCSRVRFTHRFHAGWYWDSATTQQMGRFGDFERITRRINGGVNGLEDRYALLEAAREAVA